MKIDQITRVNVVVSCMIQDMVGHVLECETQNAI